MALHSRLLSLLLGLALTGTAAAANSAPNLTNISTLPGGIEDQDFQVTYTILAAFANASDSDGDAILFRLKSGNVYLADGVTPVPVNGTLGENQTWVWKPAANANGTLNAFVVRAYDGMDESNTNEQVKISVTPVNDPPVMGGAMTGTSGSPLLDTPNGESPAEYAVFQNLTVSDIENDNQTVVVTVNNASSDYGTFSLGSVSPTSSGNSKVYTRSGLSPAQAQTLLRQAKFIVDPNAVGVGTYNFDISAKVTDSDPSNIINGPIYVSSVNDKATIDASLNPTSMPDSGTVTPFFLNVSDVDFGETFRVDISNQSAGGVGTLDPASPSFTGTAKEVSAYVRTITFTPQLQSQNRTGIFDVVVTEVHPAGTENTNDADRLNLAIQFVNDPPEIVGINTSLIRTTDDESDDRVFPFSIVTINDLDPGQQLTVNLTLDDPAKGSFLREDGVALVLPLVGSASDVTAILRQIYFKPTPNTIPVNQSETRTITLSVNDGTVERTNSQTRIEVTAVDGAPKVRWLLAGDGRFPTAASPAQIDPTGSATPFTSVSIEDDSVLTVVVTIDDANKGSLSDGDQDSGNDLFHETAEGSGIYEFTGSATDATTAIQALVYELNPSYIFPPGQPGRTDFTIAASDSVLNTTTRVLPIVLESDVRSFMVTSLVDNAALPGTLRHAIAAAADNDMITFALASYPATIRLTAGPLVIDKHLNFRGPGADKLTISGDANSNGLTDPGDTRIFEISTQVTIRGIRLARGYGATGGAISVTRREPGLRAGSLVIEDCVIANCLATQWGGAIDVDDGSLRVERCLFENNRLNASSGKGGGAVSLYTSAQCDFINTTFVGNSQAAPTGLGGGAIYAENLTPSVVFNVGVTHCTFSSNSDAANQGSSIHSNVANTRVKLVNSIFADFSARNLAVAGTGEILSGGGNLSNDNTTTTLIQGGVPQETVLLGKEKDLRNEDPHLAPLATVQGGVRAQALMPGSLAIGGAVAGKAAVDQRGVRRNATADKGALDFDAFGKLVIHEIQVSPVAGQPQFIEFFNPRDQAAFDVNGYELWIDGLKRHTFVGVAPVKAGFGLLVADTDITPALPVPPVPAAAKPVVIPDNPLNLQLRGRIELRVPDAANPPVTMESALAAGISYVAEFANDAVEPAITRDYENDSITLAPQFQGAAMVPHRLVLPPPNGGVLLTNTGDPISPGGDSTRTAFGAENANPIAVTDRFEINEDQVASLDVLANDLDADGADELFIVDLNNAVGILPLTLGTTPLTSAGGAGVSVTPAAVPLKGTSVDFDPREAFRHLPEGARVTDSFAYSIVDYGGGPISGYANGGANTTLITAPSHRLDTNDVISIQGAVPASYNYSGPVTRVSDDSFSIPVAFTTAPLAAEQGRWQAAVSRTTDAPAEAKVEVTVLGRNDPPTPVADGVATLEDTVLRILADPDLLASGPALDTDVLYPAPRQFATLGLLANDTDPDTDDMPFKKLKVIGVCQAQPVGGYSGTAGMGPVTVTAANHNLADGTTILISGYGGHPSYNGYHPVTVTGPDTFTIPVGFIDADDAKGLWTVLDNSNRLATVSQRDATVTLEIRADRTKTNVVYNPRPSDELDSLAAGETIADTFYYAVEDTHGAVSLALITVTVTGVNDLPVPSDNPPGLDVLDPLLVGGTTPGQLLEDTEVLYLLPTSGSTGSVDATIRPPGAGFADVLVLAGLERTDEDSALTFSTASLLADDLDVDLSNVLSVRIEAGQESSREDAMITLSADGSTLTYDPRLSEDLQKLAFNERIVDTFEITVFDGIAGVPSLVAVVVEGRNDSPVASLVSLATLEKSLLEVPTPGMLLSGVEIDQNTRLPDNRRFLLPVSDQGTDVFGAKVNIALTRRNGTITGISSEGGLTAFFSADHGLQNGEEVIITGSGALTGQYPVTRIDASKFSIAVNYDASFAALSGGKWTVLASDFSYDPRGSVFPGAVGGPAFTLQGLAENVTYVDSFTYTLLDGSFLFANDDIFRVGADRSSIELPVLLNDTNLDGLATSRKILSIGPPSSGGTVTINPGSESIVAGETVIVEDSIIYTPETGFVGDEVFVYTIEDNLGNRASAKVTARVTIDRLNGNLRANADRFTVAAGESPLLDVLANDSIIPATGAPLTLGDISTPSAGGTAVRENGAIRYTPATPVVPGSYTETFSYSMSGGGSASAVATVSVLVVNRTEALNVRDDSFSIPASSSDVVLNVLENDNVLPGTGDALTITAHTTPTFGSVTIVDDVALSYTPPAGFLGTATFSYTASDGFGGGGTAEVTVNVGYLTTNNDIFSVPFDDSAETDDNGFSELDVLANDSVLQGGAGQVTLTAVSPASSSLGDISVAPGGLKLRFDPAVDQTGQQDFVYTITDSSGRTADGTVTVVVIASGIRASSDYFTVQTDSQNNLLPVVANDLRISELPGQLSVSAIGTGPDAPDQGGTVEISADFSSITYTAAPGFSGVESFTYTVTDGDSFDTARVSVRSTIGELVAADDSFFAFRGSENNRLAVLSNDRVIPDAGQLLFITATGLEAGPANRGTLEIIEDGAALEYTPSELNTSFPYDEYFSYEISAGGTARSEGIIHIQVLDRVGARDLETNDDVFSVRSDSAATLLPVLANDSVLPASTGGWEITSVTQPTANVCSPFLVGDFPEPGLFAAELDGRVDPVSQFLWPRFSPESQLLLGNASTPAPQLLATLVAELNAVVEAGASIYDATRFAGVVLREETQELVTEGVAGEQLIVLNRMLLEDAFPAFIQAAPSGGGVQISGANILYAPQPGFAGTQRFTYRVSDGLGGTGFAEVIVRVGDVSVSDDSFTLLAGADPVALDVTANDGILETAFPAESEPAQGDFTLSPYHAITVDPVAAGSAVLDGDQVLFTATAYVGPAVLTYWVVDDSGCEFPGIARLDIHAPGEDRDTAIASITVTGVNDPPELINVGLTNTLDTESVQPFADATVIEYDEQRAQLVTLQVSYPIGHGVLSGGGFTEVSPGVLEFRGTAAEITAALRALVFTPYIDRITVGTTEDTRFVVSMDDGFTTAPVVVDEAYTEVTPVNDPPVITGTMAGQKVYQRSTLYPFAGVNITDVDDITIQPQTVTVQVDNAIKGFFSNLGGFVQTPAASGTYVFTGTPAQVSAALRGLLFNPTPDGRVTAALPETVGLSVSINDGFAAPVVDQVTTVVVLHGEVDRLLPLGAAGQDISEEAAAFGTSVAVSGNTMVVGSPGRELPGSDAGRAYVYERDAGFGAPWGQVATLIGSDTLPGDRFGEAVAIDGDFMAIGAPAADISGVNNTGVVYIFQRDPGNPNAWTQVLKIASPTPVNNDAFGTGIAIQGTTLLVGSPNTNRPGAQRAGRVHVFNRGAAGPANWIFFQTLLAGELRSSGLSGDGEFFGFSVALDGETAVIGAHGSNRSANTSQWNYGAAHIFIREPGTGLWNEFKRLEEFEQPEAQSHSGFGYSVDISGDRIAVGIHSVGAPFNAFKAGGARIFERNSGGANNWGEVRRMVGFDGTPSAYFGTSIAIDDDLVLIGAPGPSQGSLNSRGSVEVYRRTPGVTPTWTAIDRFIPGAPTAIDLFGTSVALDGFIGVAGAAGEGVNALGVPNAGGARVYKFHYDLGPRLTVPVPDQLVVLDSPLDFTVDPVTFDDPVSPGQLTVSVQLSDGNPLPPAGWLAFDPVTRTFSGTPTAANHGDYELVLVATNPLGSRVLSNVFQIAVDTSNVMVGLTAAYEAWAATRFSPAELGNPALESTVWGMEANPEGDGSVNLLEMLFGTEPDASDPSPLVFTRISDTQVTLEFPITAEFPLGDIHVEWSTGLGSWSRDGVVLVPAEVTPGNFRMTATITAPAPRQKVFVRVVAGS